MVLIAVLILVLLAVVAAATGYSLVARRVKALQAGAAFTFDYEITSTADSPALYTILQKTGSTKGTVNGLYAPDALQLSISAPDAVIPAGPLTRVYISSSETLYDVGQLYKNIRSSITGSYPLASLLLPDWSLGSYISQAQLASLLGVDTTATSLQDMTEFELPQKKLQRVQPENAKDGYLYFQLDTGDASANAPVLVSGWKEQVLCGCHPGAHPAHHPGTRGQHPAHWHRECPDRGAHCAHIPHEGRRHPDAGADPRYHPERAAVRADRCQQRTERGLIFPQTSKARNGNSRFWLLFCHFTGRGCGHRWRR